MVNVGAVEFGVRLKLDDVRQEVAKLNRRFANTAVTIPIRLQVTQQDIAALNRRIQQQTRTAQPRINVGLDINQSEINRLNRQVAQQAQSVKINATVDASNTRQLTQALSQTKTEASSLNAVLAGLSAAAGFAAIQAAASATTSVIRGVVGVITEAITEFENFEAALARFDAKAQGTNVNLKEFGDEVKNVAQITSFTPAQIADLGDQLAALGVPAEQVQGRLESVAKAADVLGEDPVLTGRVIQGSIQAYERFGLTADRATDILVKLRNETALGARSGLAEFEQAASKTAPIAAELGVSFEELAAAFAVFRQSGATAQVSATALTTLLARIATNAKELADQGIEVEINETGGIDLQETLINIRDRIEGLDRIGKVDFLAGIFGESAARDAISALGQLDANYQDFLDKAINSSGAVEETYGIISENLLFQSKLLEGQIATGLTSLGEALAPVKLGFVELAREIFRTADVDLGGLATAAQTLQGALSGDPELVRRLALAFENLAQSGVDTLQRIIEALTALAENENAVEGIARTIEDIGIAIEGLGELTSFVIALGESFATLRGDADNAGVAVAGFTSNTAGLTALGGPLGSLLATYQALTAEAEKFAGIDVGIGEDLANVAQAGAQSIEPFVKAANAVVDAERKAAEERLAIAEGLADGQAETAEQASKRITDALKAERDAAEIREQRQFEDEVTNTRQRQEDQINAAKLKTEQEINSIKRQTEDEITAIKRQTEAEINDQKRALEEELNAASRRAEEEIESLKRRAQEELQRDEQAFQSEQQRRADAFAEEQQRKRKAAESEFGALESEVDRRVQLDAAESPEERRALEEQFKKEREEAERRRDIERDVLRERRGVLREAERAGELELSPLEQARADFEDQLKEEERTFQSEQNARELEFQAQLEARKLEIEQQIEQRKLETENAIEQRRLEIENAIEQRKLEIEDAIEERKLNAEEQIATLKENSEQELLQQRRSNEQELLDLRRNFEDEQRRLNEESARKIAAEQARILREGVSTTDAVVSTQSLRSGGVVDGAPGTVSPVQVHADEFLMAPAGTRVVSQAESRRLVQQHLQATMPALGATPMPSVAFAGAIQQPRFSVSTQSLDRKLEQLISSLEGGAGVSVGSVTLATPDPVADAAALLMDFTRSRTRGRR